MSQQLRLRGIPSPLRHPWSIQPYAPHPGDLQFFISRVFQGFQLVVQTDRKRLITCSPSFPSSSLETSFSEAPASRNTVTTSSSLVDATVCAPSGGFTILHFPCFPMFRTRRSNRSSPPNCHDPLPPVPGFARNGDRFHGLTPVANDTGPFRAVDSKTNHPSPTVIIFANTVIAPFGGIYSKPIRRYIFV